MPKKTIIPSATPCPNSRPRCAAHNYQEVTLGYTAEQATAEAKRCLNAPNPAVSRAARSTWISPRFLKHVEQGDFQAAMNLIKETNALPAITGRVCPQETQCEGSCVLCKKYEAGRDWPAGTLCGRLGSRPAAGR